MGAHPVQHFRFRDIDQRERRVAVLVAGLTALYAIALVGGLMPATHSALFGFIVPLGVLALALLALAVMAGRAWAMMAMLAIVIFGLSLSFRIRELGEVGLDWQNGAKLGCWALLFGLGLMRWRDLVPVLASPIPALLVLLGGMAFLSAAWSLTPTYTIASAMGFMAYLFLAAMVVRDLSLDRTILVILSCLSAFIVLSMIGAILTPDISWMPPSVEETEYRLQGYAGHPNGLGQMAGIFMIFAIIAERRRLIGRGMLAVLMGTGIAVIFLASSRTILGAVLFAWFVVALRHSRYALPLVFAGLTLLGVVLVIAGLGMLADLETLFTGLSRTGSSHEIMTLTGRTDIWAVAAEKIAQKPLFGWGYNATEALISGSFGETFYGNPVNAHNTYLQLLLSLGMIGAAPGFLVMLAGVWLFFARPDDTRDLIVALYLFNGLAEADGFATPVLLLLIFFWAFVQDAARARVNNSADRHATGAFPSLSHGTLTGREMVR